MLAFGLGYAWWATQPGYLSLEEADHLMLDNIPDIPITLVRQLQPYQEAMPTVLHGWNQERGLLASVRQLEGAKLSWLGAPFQQDEFALLDQSYVEVYLNPQSDNDTILLRSTDGDAFSYQSLSLETGQFTPLSTDSAWYSPVLWSPSGEWMAFSSDRRSGFAELYLNQVGATEFFEPVLTDADWYAIEWAPNNEKLLVHGDPILDRPIGLLDLEQQQLDVIHPVLTPSFYESVHWSGDGQGLYLTSNQGSEFVRLRYYDLQRNTLQILTQKIPWDIEEFAVSPSGDYVAFTANEGGSYQLYLMDTTTHDWEPVVSLPKGMVNQLTFHPDGTHLAAVLDNAQSPGDVYVMQLETLEWVRWTDQNRRSLKQDSLVLPELIEYPGSNHRVNQQKQVPAYYYHPAEARQPVPVLIHIHGGPFYQFLPTFDPLIQYLVNELNIAVIAPNVRGSTGYGPGYQQLDDGMLREHAIRDMGALLDWIAEQPELDASRVAVGGGSYGGYMALTMMARYGNRLIAGIDFAGMSDLVRMVEDAAGNTLTIFRREYGDERKPDDVDFLKNISPLYQARQITKPLLVIQGENDDIVDPVHSEQMVKAVRRHGGNVWYLQVKNEGHRFLRKNNQEIYNYIVSLFLKTYLFEES